MKNKFDSQNFLYLAILCIATITPIFLDIEILHPESRAFIYNYSRDLPLMNLIFDPLNNDWGLYQGREFSYLIDYLDVKYMALWAKWRSAHFYSLSYFICCMTIICVQQYYGNRLFRNLTKIEIFSASMIFVTLPNILTGAIFFRSSKPLCSLFICVICYLSLLLFKRGTIPSIKQNRTTIAAIIFFEILLVSSDKQGVFFVSVFGIITAIFLMLSFLLPKMSSSNSRSLATITIGSAAVIFLSVLYNGLICPVIIHACNGYYPDFNYQKGQAINFAAVINGLEVFFRFTGVIVGSMGIWSGFAVIFGIFFMLGYPLRKSIVRRKSRMFCQQLYFILTYILLIPAAAVMFIIMVQRHLSIAAMPELQSSSYTMPLLVILVFFLTLALDRLQINRSGKFKNAASVLLLALAFINLMPLQHFLMLQRKGHLKYYYTRTPDIKNIINSGSNPKDYLLLLPDDIRVIQSLSKGQTPDK